jgi:CRISPR-associated protein Csd2
MAVRGLYIFSHDNPRGNAPAHKLLERVKVARKEGVQFARSFEDYEVQVDNHLPDGVSLTVLGV